jgi:alpha-ketoglutarate-dependent taurine dioxygenase
VPIYTAHAGLLNVLYKREYIDLAQRWEDVPELTSAQIEVLDLMDVVCNELALSFQMEPGDLVVANNYDILHARAAFQNQTADDDGRHMLRLWLSLPNGRPLPPIF